VFYNVHHESAYFTLNVYLRLALWINNPISL